MNMNGKDKDVLKMLFSRMPKESLPASFRDNIMQKILLESVKMRKRSERIGLFSVIFASLFMITLVGLSFSYFGISEIKFRVPNLVAMPFYIYLGVLVLLLLFADYKFRQVYKRKHQL